MSGAGGTRTPDPLRAKQVLSHLSYSPVSSAAPPLDSAAEPLQQPHVGLVNAAGARAFLFSTGEMG